ncbi:MAG: ribosome hibernation-promoting factor, HPF/YfiA family [Flavobacteriales bacterium]
MKVNVQTPHFSADKKLISFINKKLSKLELFYDRIIFADVFLKVENVKDKGNKLVEMLISIPGDDVVAKKEAKTFEEGIDECVKALERQLKKRKEKERAFS